MPRRTVSEIKSYEKSVVKKFLADINTAIGKYNNDVGTLLDWTSQSDMSDDEFEDMGEFLGTPYEPATDLREFLESMLAQYK